MLYHRERAGDPAKLLVAASRAVETLGWNHLYLDCYHLGMIVDEAN
jgi:UDP-glucose 4-epimerase